MATFQRKNTGALIVVDGCSCVSSRDIRDNKDFQHGVKFCLRPTTSWLWSSSSATRSYNPADWWIPYENAPCAQSPFELASRSQRHPPPPLPSGCRGFLSQISLLVFVIDSSAITVVLESQLSSSSHQLPRIPHFAYFPEASSHRRSSCEISALKQASRESLGSDWP